ncbi:MAG TPA: tRNA (adenosine(37)-N6)-threonylcarbamoyltransferase complex transferase subunit TsaD [Xanthobacteraceae bacterium]|jgi:N6-L-threonylcarbamoyladenine synthase|nr:tRNA (adenosine(37)-N6)-threonylcarbamoyltransferase complex transferase subunit TsaD [Xanthobacteraceae bacterium]
MLLLGIETTCDETSAAVVERDSGGNGTIRSNIVLSQLEEHKPFGGVVPEIAARAHVQLLDDVIRKAMLEAKIDYNALDGVAASAGPGLIGGVIVGLTTAKAMSLALQKPLIAVNHLEAHALTARLTHKLDFPYLLLLVSGGHTQLVFVEDVGTYTRIGTTRDDAIGEAFDKTAKLLGLPYPGGPAVERCAQDGDPKRFALPRPMIGRPEPDFSLSGLKTAIRIEAEKIAPISRQDIADLCASFQAAITDVIADRVQTAVEILREKSVHPNALVVAGGVAANRSIRTVMEELAISLRLPLVIPPPELCTDNGAMVAWAGLERLVRNMTDPLDIKPRARWPLDINAPARNGFGFAQEPSAGSPT